MKTKLVLDIPDMAELSVNDPEAFALNRRKGFGASDSSILLGVNHWTDIATLIHDKNSTEITEEEMAIGNKPQVRMGADLEPLILEKFIKEFGQFYPDSTVEKPSAQYRFKDYPYMTVNYDGIISGEDIPVECKCVSTYARKYWNFDASIHSPEDGVRRRFDSSNIKDCIENEAKLYGIPPYYYTQIQQQLMGCKSNFAYLVALDVKEWSIHIYKIYENDDVQDVLVCTAAAMATECKEMPQPC